MGKRRTRLITLAILGALLVVIGAGFVYWPAALIIAGVATVAVGVLSDDGEE